MHYYLKRQVARSERIRQVIVRHLLANPYSVLGCTVYLLLYLVWLLINLPETPVVSLITNLFSLPLSLFACVVAWRVAKLRSQGSASRYAWRLFAASHLTVTLGDAAYTLLTFFAQLPTQPSWLDGVYILQYSLLISALLLLALPSLDIAERLTFWLDVGIVGIGSSLVIWATVLLPIVANGYNNVGQAVVLLGYPVFDALILFGLVTLALCRQTSIVPLSLLVLFVGTVVNLLGDLAYSRLALENIYVGGSWPTFFWMFYYACAVWSGQIQYTSLVRQQRESAKRLWTWLPYLGIGASYAVLVALSQPLWWTPVGLAIFGVLGLNCLVVLRQIVVVRADRAAQRRALLAAAALERANDDLERKRIELELARSEAHRYALVRALPDTILRVTSEGIILDHHVSYRSEVDFNLGDLTNVSLGKVFFVPDDLVIYVDHDRFLQIVTNLLSNAAKFSPPYSVVDIQIDRVDGCAQLAIQDYGPGIPTAFHNHIFDKFAQADGSDARTKAGSGLGLSIAKALVEQFNGHISFTTVMHKGTTFFVCLPEYDATHLA